MSLPLDIEQAARTRAATPNAPVARIKLALARLVLGQAPPSAINQLEVAERYLDGRASREELAALRTTTDKAKLIDALNKGFAHAKSELEALDPAQMTGKRQVMGQSRSAIDTAFAIGGDLHEHLGQLIAYARTNHVVPPWSK